MTGRSLRLAAVIAGLLVASAAAAGDGGWVVARLTGEAWIADRTADPALLRQGERFPAGTTIATGRTGRALLVRGRERVVVGPGSVVGLPARAARSGGTTLLHHAGQMLLDVEKRNARDFVVETPKLAVAVKGTQFAVAVGPRGGSSVDVLKGRVEVLDKRTGRTASLAPR